MKMKRCRLDWVWGWAFGSLCTSVSVCRVCVFCLCFSFLLGFGIFFFLKRGGKREREK